ERARVYDRGGSCRKWKEASVSIAPKMARRERSSLSPRACGTERAMRRVLHGALQPRRQRRCLASLANCLGNSYRLTSWFVAAGWVSGKLLAGVSSLGCGRLIRAFAGTGELP